MRGVSKDQEQATPYSGSCCAWRTRADEEARGEIVVRIDSDSIIEPGALAAIAGAFRDRTVGAVGGRVSVLNRFDSLLPHMLHVRYVLSFDIVRSARSCYGPVYCCPGAFSA